MRLRLVRGVPVIVSILVVATVAPAYAEPGADPAATPPPGETPNGASGATETYDVTLVTGDTARLTVAPDGTERATLVQPASRSGYHAFVQGGDAYLVPAAAQRLVAADALDLQLFNVSALVEQGLDDEHSTEVPLIVTYDAGTAGALAARPVPAGAARATVLESIDAVALEAVKADGPTFWSDVVEVDPAQTPTGLVDGIGKIWLDSRVEASLDQSAGEIGAPAAWERGLTGEGSTIAVLDTGIDATHADFQDRIGSTADFTGGDSITDVWGHGTHVASIAAGSGAASKGAYRGIAPEATVLVGKVLGDDGTGSMSWAIDGMEWAAGQGADVVNLSLGGPVTRGDDPMSQAIDRLTAEHDTLFVVAAGNHSPWEPGMHFVTSPASADSALAVGGLHRPSSLWGGSRGGRMDGDALKPEIVAPGFGITAAGSSDAGLPPYVSQTGTSMAAPHVAGAAALLKQQHPDWGATELRAALTSTAAPIDPYFTSFEQGSGRVDIDRATRQEVLVSDGVLHLGDMQRPYEPDELKVSRTLTYRNASAEPLVLDLATSLRQGRDGTAQDGVLTVDPQTLELPAGGTGEVTVSLDATDLPGDTYSGDVTASSDSLVVRTTVGFEKQDDMVDVTLRAVDRHGRPGEATVRIAPYLEHDARYHADYVYLSPDQPEYTVRLPEGEYNLWSLMTTYDESGRFPEHESVVGDPRLSVSGPDVDVTLDARTAVPVSLDTPRPSTPRSMSTSWWRGEPGTTLYSEDTWYWSFNDGEPENVSVSPTERVDDAPFGLATSFDSGVAPLAVSVRGHVVDATQVGGPQIDGKHLLPMVDADTAGADDLAGLDLTGAVALVQESPAVSHEEQVRAAAAAGAVMVALYSAEDGVFWPRRAGGPVPVLAMSRDQGEQLAALTAGGSTVPVKLDVQGTPRTPYAYDVSFNEQGRIPESLAYEARPEELAQVTANIHTTGTGEHGWRLRQTAFTGCDCGGPAVDDYVPSTGYTRTEYVTAGADSSTITAWQFLFDFPGDIVYSRGERSYQPGETVTENWLKAPFSPGVPQSEIRAAGVSPVSTRTGDWMHFALSPFTDSDGHWTPSFSPTSATARVLRDGKPIYENPWALRGDLPLPVGEATYRIEADVDHDGSKIALATSTRSAWTFRSAGSASTTVLPLIDVDYVDVVDAATGTTAIDLSNTAGSGQEVRLILRAAHQDGSAAEPVDRMTVRVSYDDGRTWQDAEVTGAAGEFSALYRHPAAGNGYVALQVVAEDPSGGALEQTLLRAYRVG
jgi:subtilisin family serine protease